MAAPRKRPSEIIKKALLIGEGIDDMNVFKALRDHMNLRDSLHVWHYGGKNKLPLFIADLRSTTGFKALRALGITRDADTDTVGALKSVQSALGNAGFPVPAEQMKTEAGKPSVSIMILPNTDNPGDLETLCRQAVAETQAAVCVNRYLECLREQGISLPGHPHDSKAWVRAYIASQHDPEKRPGEAAFAGYWPWDSPVFDKLKLFIRQLDQA